MKRILQGRYELLKEIGHGGMAEVYLAKDLLLERKVAVKILYPHLAKEKEGRERFLREAKATAKLKHPNIVEIYDFSGLSSDEIYIVSEFVDGITLKEFIDSFYFEVPEIGLMIISEVLAGLAKAHEEGIIHRDIKPENIMVTKAGEIKIMDFGIARIKDVESLTQTDALIGSPLYMSPEQIDGKELDPRSDIFSTGIVLYYIVTNSLPFLEKTPHKILKKISEGIYEKPDRKNPAVGKGIRKIIVKALERDPIKRYQTAYEFRSDIVNYLKKYDIVHIREEVANFFKNPADYQQNLKKNLVEKLYEEAKALLKEKKFTEGMDNINRILAFDPEHKGALELTSGIKKKRGIKSVIYTIFGILAAVILGFSVYILLLPEKSDNPNLNLIKKPAKHETEHIKIQYVKYRNRPYFKFIKLLKRQDCEQKLSNFKEKPGRKLEDNNKHKPSPHFIKKNMVKSRRLFPVTIVAFPPAVKIFINNRYVATGKVEKLHLKPGEYKITLKHPTCKICMTTVYKLKLTKPPTHPIRLPIKYLNSFITVKSKKQGIVYINNIKKGKTNDRIKLFPRFPDNNYFHIKVVFDDNSVKFKKIKIKPGESRTIEF